MQPLNALDAIAPAFTRTHETVFQPFRLGRSWKLCASNYVALLGSMFFPFPILFFLAGGPGGSSALLPRMLLIGIGVFYSTLLLVFLYFGGRMELVVFEMLVTRAKFVAPMWKRYGGRVWPWLGLKVGVGTACMLVVSVAAIVPMRRMLAGFSRFSDLSRPGGTPLDPAAMQVFVRGMLGFEAIIFLLFFLLKIPSTLLNDFVLPFYVLEDIPLMSAVRRGTEVFLRDPLQVILYCVLKPVLFLIGVIMQYLALMVCMIPFVIVIVVVALIGGLGFRHGGAGAGLLLVAAGVVLYLVFLAFIFYLSIGTLGYLLALFEAYGIYFLGGRYPLLGNLLEPESTYSYTPPPTFPSADEGDDDGPTLPMDPVVA